MRRASGERHPAIGGGASRGSVPPIRRLTPDDADTYRAFMLAAYARDGDAFTATAGERAALPRAWWAARLAPADDAPSVVLGAADDDRLLGVVGVRRTEWPRERHKATVFGMAVAPDARRLGLGRALLAAAVDAARQMDGVRLLQLTVTDTNVAARRLYASFGFEAFGVEPMAIRTDDGFAAKVHLWLRLDTLPGS